MRHGRTKARTPRTAQGRQARCPPRSQGPFHPKAGRGGTLPGRRSAEQVQNCREEGSGRSWRSEARFALTAEGKGKWHLTTPTAASLRRSARQPSIYGVTCRKGFNTGCSNAPSSVGTSPSAPNLREQLAQFLHHHHDAARSEERRV